MASSKNAQEIILPSFENTPPVDFDGEFSGLSEYYLERFICYESEYVRRYNSCIRSLINCDATRMYMQYKRLSIELYGRITL